MKALLLAGLFTASLALATPVTSQSQSTTSSASSPTAASTVTTTLSYSTPTTSGSKFTTPSTTTTSLGGGVKSYDVVAPGVPEPSSVVLLGTGLLLLTMSARRLRRPA